jgi:hypothetical protein
MATQSSLFLGSVTGFLFLLFSKHLDTFRPVSLVNSYVLDILSCGGNAIHAICIYRLQRHSRA